MSLNAASRSSSHSGVPGQPAGSKVSPYVIYKGQPLNVVAAQMCKPASEMKSPTQSVSIGDEPFGRMVMSTHQQVAKRIFVHRHYKRDTRDISSADDLEVVADTHDIELKNDEKESRR